MVLWVKLTSQHRALDCACQSMMAFVLVHQKVACHNEEGRGNPPALSTMAGYLMNKDKTSPIGKHNPGTDGAEPT